eukprot:12593378-Alexandrium_andersonii.AAC.1
MGKKGAASAAQTLRTSLAPVMQNQAKEAPCFAWFLLLPVLQLGVSDSADSELRGADRSGWP